MVVAFALAVASTAFATLPGFRVVGPLTVALLAGMSLRAVLGMPAPLVDGIRFSAKTVLRLGIVLMGARLNFSLVAEAGPAILLLDVVIIVVGIVGIRYIARRFGVPAQLAILLAVGTSICGASAVVAAASVTKASEDDTTLAVGLCGILGTAGVLLYVFGAPMLGLSTGAMAILSGSTLHEVAQVMAAAFTWGTEAGDLGTLVKLTRVVLLAPALVVLGLASGGAVTTYSWREPPIPWFVIGFLAMGVLASVGLLPLQATKSMSTASVFLMVTAMAAMGFNTSFQLMRQAGVRVIWAGAAGFLMLAGMSLALILLLGLG